MNPRHLDDDTWIALLLGELPKEEDADARSHAAACGACGDLLARMTNAISEWRETPLPDPHPGVLVGLLEAQAAARHLPGRRGVAAPLGRGGIPRWRVPGFVAAAVAGMALVFAAGYGVGLRRGDGPRVVVQAPAPARDALPPPPRIAFQSTPPMDAWFAGMPNRRTPPSAGGSRDSL